MKKILITKIAVLCLGIMGIGEFVHILSKDKSDNPTEVQARRCTGKSNCRACKNCRYCAHCSIRGNSCGVCR